MDRPVTDHRPRPPPVEFVLVVSTFVPSLMVTVAALTGRPSVVVTEPLMDPVPGTIVTVIGFVASATDESIWKRCSWYPALAKVSVYSPVGGTSRAQAPSFLVTTRVGRTVVCGVRITALGRDLVGHVRGRRQAGRVPRGGVRDRHLDVVRRARDRAGQPHRRRGRGAGGCPAGRARAAAVGTRAAPGTARTARSGTGSARLLAWRSSTRRPPAWTSSSSRAWG